MRLEEWRNHFATLLGQPVAKNRNSVSKIVQDTLLISTNAFTMEELNTSINSFANNKTPNIDEIQLRYRKVVHIQ